jgi:ribosomal protein L7Ae-like RNA K-turn-binding protein
MRLQKKHGIQHIIQKIKREKIQALSLAKDCYSMKLELLTNATVVDDAIRFVSSNKSKEVL